MQTGVHCCYFVYLRCSRVVEAPGQLQDAPNDHPKSQGATRGPFAPTALRRNPPLLQAPTWTDWWETSIHHDTVVKTLLTSKVHWSRVRMNSGLIIMLFELLFTQKYTEALRKLKKYNVQCVEIASKNSAETKETSNESKIILLQATNNKAWSQSQETTEWSGTIGVQGNKWNREQEREKNAGRYYIYL